MASVEQPELHVLVGLDVGHEFGARLSQAADPAGSGPRSPIA